MNAHTSPSSSGLSDIEEKMRNGMGGVFRPFLENHMPLDVLLARDAEAVTSLGLTLEDFSTKVDELFDCSWRDLPHHAQSHHDFLISPDCPICGEAVTRVKVPHTAEIVLIERDKVARADEIIKEHGQLCYTVETFPQLISECGALIVPELFRHSIKRHGFFGGAYPYRIEPRAFAAAVGLIPWGTK